MINTGVHSAETLHDAGLHDTYDALGIPSAHATAIPEVAESYLNALINVHSSAYMAAHDASVAAEFGIDSSAHSADEISAMVERSMRSYLNLDVIAEAYKAEAVQEAGEDYDSAGMYVEALDTAVATAIPELVVTVQNSVVSQNSQQTATAIRQLSLLGITCEVPMQTHQYDQPIAIVRRDASRISIPKKVAVGTTLAASALTVVGTVTPAAATETTPTPSPTSSSVSAELNPVTSDTPLPEQSQTPETPAPTATDVPPTVEPSSEPAPSTTSPAPEESTPTTQPEPTPTVTAIEAPITADADPVFIKPAPPTPEVSESREVVAAPETVTAPKNLSAEIGGQYANMQTALKQGTFNAYSPTEDQFNPLIGNSSKHLTVPLTDKAKTILQAKISQFDSIIAGDQETILAALKDFDITLDDQMRQELANYIQNDDFVKQGQPLSIEQRIAIMHVIQSTHQELTPEAKVAYTKALKEAKDDTKKSPEHKKHAVEKYSILLPKIHDEQKLAAAIDAYILDVAPDSPFVGQGMNFVKGAKKHGVDPLLPVVIAQMDSNFGTKGVAAHYHTNNPWNRDCPDGKPRVHYTDGRSGHNHSACTYDSPEQALLQDDYEGMEAARKGHDSIFAYIERKYINHGITKLEDFLAIYTPAAESSDAEHQHLLNGYKQQYDKLYELAGDSISFGIRLSTLKDLPEHAGSRYVSEAVARAAKPGEPLFGPDDPCAQLNGNVRVLCGAKKFFGIRYGTADPGYAPKWSRIWNQKITSWGGHGPLGWIIRNKKGSTNDFLECSGFVAVAFMTAYSQDVDTCSAGFLSDKKNFKEIDPHDVRPGDLVIAARWCGGKQGGHVGIVESYDKRTKRLVTYESSAGMSSKGWARSGRITHHKIGEDFHYAVRYIGPGSDADLQSAA